VLLAIPLLLAIPPRGHAQKEALPVSEEVAKEAVANFKREYRSRDFKVRLAAVDQLTRLKHAKVASCLSQALIDPHERVRAEAARRLGLQDPQRAIRPLRSALLARRNQKTPDVLIAVFEAYRQLESSPEIQDLKSFDRWEKEIQREAIITLRYLRKVKTVEFLADYLDMPQPANVDSPTNPPASYWRGKVERWTYWIADLQETLHELTGETFEEEDQVREWRRRGGRVLVQSPSKTGR
jgi:hypothetical protein